MGCGLSLLIFIKIIKVVLIVRCTYMYNVIKLEECKTLIGASVIELNWSDHVALF